MIDRPSRYRTVWLGFAPSGTLSVFLTIHLSIGLVTYLGLSSSGIPPLAPLLISTLAFVFAAGFMSERWVSKRIIWSGGEIDGQDDGADLGLLQNVYGVPTWSIIALLAVLSISQLMFIFVATNSPLVVAATGIEGAFGFALGLVLGVDMSMKSANKHGADLNGGEIPSVFSGRFWKVESVSHSRAQNPAQNQRQYR